jgi:hypothetical protein
LNPALVRFCACQALVKLAVRQNNNTQPLTLSTLPLRQTWALK